MYTQQHKLRVPNRGPTTQTYVVSSPGHQAPPSTSRAPEHSPSTTTVCSALPRTPGLEGLLCTYLQGCPKVRGNSNNHNVTVFTYNKDICHAEVFFETIMHYVVTREIGVSTPVCTHNQRFELTTLLPVLPVPGNTNICSTSMTST